VEQDERKSEHKPFQYGTSAFFKTGMVSYTVLSRLSVQIKCYGFYY